MAVKDNQRLKKKKLFLGNSSGASVVEMLPLLVVFVILFGLTFGLWQSIHAGTLGSIAARHYAFEVINNRTHIIYHRDTKPPGDDKQYYKKNGYRFFASVESQPTTTRPDPKAEKKQINRFNFADTQIAGKREGIGNYSTGQVNPIKLKIGYGICLDCQCGGTACN